jgi:hypothetical protein
MDLLTKIKAIADDLDSKGFLKQADILDFYLKSYAQVAADDPQTTETSKENPALVLSHTTFLMLAELRDFYSKNLPKFKYFGEQNIKTLQSAIDQLTAMYRVLLRNMSPDFDKEALSKYETHLKGLQSEVDRSKEMKLTPIKVKVDKFLLYDEFEMIMRKIERHYDAGIRELQPVLKKARSIRDAFANIIQQTSEEIAHADLIETR